MEDPLPLPFMKLKHPMILWHSRKTKQLIVLMVCLFLGITLVVFPHVVLEVGKPGLWIIKYNSNITQAPRGGFFGALVVLPQNNVFESVLLPQLREINKEVIEVPSQIKKYWLVKVWYGSSYT